MCFRFCMCTTSMSFVAAVVQQNVISHKILTKIIGTSCVYQSVRWRKTRRNSVAPSKKFHVPEKKVFDPEESAELQRRVNHYNTALRAVRNFIHVNFNEELKRKKTRAEQTTADQEEFERILEINTRWNENVARIREQRQSEEHELILRKISKMTEKKQMQRKQREEEAERVLLADIDKSKHFVTAETLDMEIERLLNSRTDYNFAVDSDGRKVTEIDQSSGTDESVKK